jgi:AcrR family transcriptional regulator
MDQRIARIRKEKGRELVRSAYVAELQAAGAARAVALHEAEEQLDRIAKVLEDARGAGLSMSDIARITGVSRQTLYELKGRYGSTEDLGLAVLAVVATSGAITLDALADELGRGRSEVEGVVKSYLDGHLIEETVFLDAEGEDALAITEIGEAALLDWTFPEAKDELWRRTEGR